MLRRSQKTAWTAIVVALALAAMVAPAAHAALASGSVDAWDVWSPFVEQAVSQDQDTARLMGINVDRIIVVAFALGAVLAAVAGVAQGLQNHNINFRMGFLAGLKAFVAAVLGGIGNVAGAVVGGLLLGIVEAMATQYIPGRFGGSPWKDVWAFVLLILVLVFRPQGLFGEKAVDRA